MSELAEASAEFLAAKPVAAAKPVTVPDAPRGFKQTEVGFIPEDWGLKSLYEIANVTSGKRLPLGHSLQSTRTNHPYIRVADMSPNGVRTSDIKFVPKNVFPAISNYRIFESDLFISVAGTLGIVGCIPKELDGANLTENANRIAPKKDCNRDYLKFYLNSSTVQAIIDAIRTVGAQPKLALTRIRNFQIPLPSIPEQEAIAEALTDADEAVRAVERLIEKKRAVKQATLHALLTPTIRLPGFSGEWEQANLSSISANITKGSTPTTYGYDWQTEGILFLRSECVSSKGLDLTQAMFISDVAHTMLSRSAVSGGDILITITGNIGRVIRLAQNFQSANINQHIARIRINSNQVFSEFVYHQLSRPESIREFENIVTGNAYPQISLQQVRNKLIQFPKFEEQKAIATVLSDVDIEIEALEAKRDKLLAIKHGMMQVLLTGKVRLL